MVILKQVIKYISAKVVIGIVVMTDLYKVLDKHITIIRWREGQLYKGLHDKEHEVVTGKIYTTVYRTEYIRRCQLKLGTWQV